MSPRRKNQAAVVDPSLVFVDSSAWLAFLSRDDRQHAKADTLIRRAIAARVRLLTTNLVLAEVHRLVLFRVGIHAARVALDKIGESPSVRVEYANDLRHQAARAWLGKLHDQTITLADAVSFATMDAAGCRSALSFDSDFWIAGFHPWP